MRDNEDYIDENEDFADMLAAASYQDSVTGASGRGQRELHRNVWEFWQIMRDGNTDGFKLGRRSRQAKRNDKKQKPSELSDGEKNARTAWRIFCLDLAVFILSCFLGWKILMFICAAAVSLIYSWSILPMRAVRRRFKFHDFALLLVLNAFWVGLMIWIFFGNALEPATHCYY